MPRRDSLRSSGFTLVEAVVAMTVFVMLFVGAWTLFGETGAAVQFNFRASSLDMSLRRAIRRLTEELRDSGADSNGSDRVTSHPRALTTSVSTLTFSRRTALSGAASDWGPVIRYELQPSTGETPGNGADDDDDGLVDEQELVRVEGTTNEVLLDGVTLFDAVRLAGEDQVALTMTVCQASPEGELTRSRTAIIALRNLPPSP